jgi:hypothetical protein
MPVQFWVSGQLCGLGISHSASTLRSGAVLAFRMRVSYDSDGFTGGTALLASPEQVERPPGAIRRISARRSPNQPSTNPPGASALLAARDGVIRAQLWENAVWLTLAVAGMVLLMLSFS